MNDNDPLKRLLDELLCAHDQLQAGPRRFRRRLVVVSAIALVVSASAAIAIVVETRRLWVPVEN
jgi:hypothetical protein